MAIAPPQLRRLEHRLDELFTDLIDLSDWSTGTPEQLRDAFLSRALAAYCIYYLTGADPAKAAAAITDGRNDQGIDAVYLDYGTATVYAVTSKWSHSASKSIPKDDVVSLMDGLGKILYDRWDSANQRLASKRQELFAAVNDTNTMFVAVLATTGTTALADPALKALEDRLDQFNMSSEPIIRSDVFNLARLYGSLLQGSGKSAIDIDLTLQEWGLVKEPYEAFYGQVDVASVLEWRSHGTSLFARNVRLFLGSKSSVYPSVRHTLDNEPEHFWYFNNGVTMLCDSIKKKPIYGPKRELGIFECKGISVVNGAQTIGSIWDSCKAGEELDPATKLPVRIISLEHCPPDFAASVTRAANTQNKIEPRDFAALDPNQQRLAIEMQLAGRKYVFRSGDSVPYGKDGCDLFEAATSLACNSGLEMATNAKREISYLFQDIKRPPYTTIFNDDLTSDFLWKCVKLQRAVEMALRDPDPDISRSQLIATHGNYFVLFRVFQDPEIRAFADPAQSFELFEKAAARIAKRELARIAKYIDQVEPNSYPQTIFKNQTRCQAIDSRLPRGAHQDGSFAELPLFKALSGL